MTVMTGVIVGLVVLFVCVPVGVWLALWNERRVICDSDLEVTHPPHYQTDTVEAIDAIKAHLEPGEFNGYCRGNAMKYLWRCERKGKYEQDVRKAIWYLRMAVGDDPRKDPSA